MRCSSVQGILLLSFYGLQISSYYIDKYALICKKVCIINLIATPFLPLSINIKVSHSTNHVPFVLLQFDRHQHWYGYWESNDSHLKHTFVD